MKPTEKNWLITCMLQNYDQATLTLLLPTLVPSGEIDHCS